MEVGVRVYISEKSRGPYLKEKEPYLVEEPTMRILEEPSTFLRQHYVESGKRKSPQTWRAAAYQLKVWLEFLNAQEIGWHIATVDDLKHYRNALQVSISPHSRERYDDKTVRNYMLTVISFYEFSAAKGWYEGTLSEAKDVKRVLRPIDTDALAHTRKGDPTYTRSALTDLIPKSSRNHSYIRPFTVTEWRSLTAALGPYPSEIDAKSPKLSRDRLLCEVSFWTGLRLSELLGLRTYQFSGIILDPRAKTAYSQITLDPRTTKGNVERTIRIPNWLVEEVNIYISGERSATLSLRRSLDAEKNRRTPKDYGALFVTGPDSNQPGNALKSRRCQQILEHACVTADLIDTEQRTDPETAEIRTVQVARHCFHDLRHSYAVWTYWAEKQLGNSEPWKLIQAQLGHESLHTTIDTYLHYVEIFDGATVPIDVRQLIGL